MPFFDLPATMRPCRQLGTHGPRSTIDEARQRDSGEFPSERNPETAYYRTEI